MDERSMNKGWWMMMAMLRRHVHKSFVLRHKCVLIPNPLGLLLSCVLYGTDGIPGSGGGGGVNQSLNLPWKIEFGLGPGIRFLRIGLICQGLVKVAPRKSRPSLDPAIELICDLGQSRLNYELFTSESRNVKSRVPKTFQDFLLV